MPNTKTMFGFKNIVGAKMQEHVSPCAMSPVSTPKEKRLGETSEDRQL